MPPTPALDPLARALFESHAHAAVLVREGARSVVQVNPAAERLFARPAVSAIGRSLEEALVPASPRSAELLRGGAGEWAVGSFRVGAGGRGIRLAVRRLPARPGLEVWLFRRARRAGRGRELRAVLDRAPVLLASLGPTGRGRWLNREFLRALGWSLADAPARELLARLAAIPGEGAALPLRDRAGRSRDTAWRVLPLPGGQALAVGQDVTDRSHALAGQLCERALLRHLLDAIPDAVCIKNRRGAYLGCNPAYEALVGRREADLVGLSDHELSLRPPPGDRAKELAWEEAQDRLVLADGRPRRGERWRPGPDGALRLFQVSKVIARGPGALPLGVITVARDVTRRHQPEEQPGAPQPAVVALSPPAASPPVRGTATVLLVDDEPMILTLGRTLLQANGYRALVARDGIEALEVYRSAAGTIDLVILDLTMPRLSGRDTLERLLQIDPAARVLFASGYSADAFSEEERGRVRGFVQKPWRPTDLLDAVRQALGEVGRRTADGGRGAE
jgi:PAS domain S-box-containing protein